MGAELEGPFGVDANDFPLLHWGVELSEDLDVMLEMAEYELDMARHGAYQGPSAWPRGAPTPAAAVTATDTKRRGETETQLFSADCLPSPSDELSVTV